MTVHVSCYKIQFSTSSSADTKKPCCKVGQYWPKCKWKVTFCTKRCRCKKTRSIDLFTSKNLSINEFLPRCSMQLVFPIAKVSVCPSVFHSVNCDKTKAPSEKSSIMTNRKSPTTLSMSLRWTSYVAPNPPKGASKTTIFLVSRAENWIFLEESLLQSFFVWKLSAAKL